MPLAHEHLISILDRRFSLIENFDRREYLVHLISFADFLFNDAEISPYPKQLMHEYVGKAREYDLSLTNEIGPIVAFREGLATKYPQIDDSDAEPPSDLADNRRYEWTLAYFDDLVQGNSRLIGERINTTPSHYDDNTVPGKLIGILKSKANALLDEEEGQEKRLVAEGKDPEPIPDELGQMWAEFRSLEERHKHAFRYFVNYRRASPGQALINIQEVVHLLTKKPVGFQYLRDTLANFQDAIFWTFIGEVLYNDQQDMARLDRDIDAIRKTVRIAYEGIRETIGKLAARVQVVDRYKTRCMWYDAENVRAVGEAGEVALTRHLALFLFDQGVLVTTRTRLGVHELDVVDLVHASMVVEAKVYAAKHRPSDVKKKILKGIAQLHGYMNGLDSSIGIREGFLVVFRCGGRLIDLPREIQTPRFTIVPVMIDVGEAAESGSRQPHPVVINIDEITQLFAAPPESP